MWLPVDGFGGWGGAGGKILREHKETVLDNTFIFLIVIIVSSVCEFVTVYQTSHFKYL